MNAPVLPGPLKDNPSLARWVAFPAPGQVTIIPAASSSARAY
jgi:hypothetical protein